MKLIVAIVGMLLLACPGMCGASIETDVGAFIKQIYDKKEIKVSIQQIPTHLRDNSRVRNISFSRVPDEDGEGVCLVDIENAKGQKSSVYVPFKIMLKKKLYITKKEIQTGNTIRFSDIEEKETYINGSGVSYPASYEDILSKTARRKTIPQGQIVTKEYLEDHIVLKRGEPVNITVQNEHLSIQAKGTALEKGRIGDMVKVKSTSGKEIMGKIIGSNTIAVEF